MACFAEHATKEGPRAFNGLLCFHCWNLNLSRWQFELFCEGSASGLSRVLQDISRFSCFFLSRRLNHAWRSCHLATGAPHHYCSKSNFFWAVQSSWASVSTWWDLSDSLILCYEQRYPGWRNSARGSPYLTILWCLLWRRIYQYAGLGYK